MPEKYRVRLPIKVATSGTQINISVGVWNTSDPILRPTKEADSSLKETILRANGITIPDFATYIGLNDDEEANQSEKNEKARRVIKKNKFYCSYLGPNFNKLLYRIMYKYWVAEVIPKEIRKVISHTGSRWRMIDERKVKVVHKYIKEIRSLVNSGQRNMVPLVILFNATTTEIGSVVGQNTLRLMKDSSYTKNINLSNTLTSSHPFFSRTVDLKAGLSPKIVLRLNKIWQVKPGYISIINFHYELPMGIFLQAQKMYRNLPQKNFKYFLSAVLFYARNKTKASKSIGEIENFEEFKEIFYREVKIISVMDDILGSRHRKIYTTNYNFTPSSKREIHESEYKFLQSVFSFQ